MRVLIVEDEEAIASAIERGLLKEGYAVDKAVDGQEAIEKASINNYDVVCLDLNLPKVDGLEVCRRLREDRFSGGIIMLTARSSIKERIEGLDHGADDYLVKPFALDELLARVRALLRRTSVSGSDTTVRVLDLVLDPMSRQVTRGDRPLDLTKTEFDLLELLMVNAGIVLERDVLYERIWGFDFETGSRSLDVYIGYLRRKTELDGASRLVHTVRGVGYVVRSE